MMTSAVGGCRCAFLLTLIYQQTMKKTFLLSLYLLFTLAFAKAKGSSQETDSILILKNVNIVEVSSGKILKDKSITIKNGNIAKIGRFPNKLKNARILDLNGQYVIPGLIDTHIHVTAPHKNSIEKTYSHLEYYLKHGITSARDAGGDGGALLQAQTEIRKGNRMGTDVFFSSFMAGDWYYNRGQNIRKDPYSSWEQRLMPGDDLDKAMAEAKACGATGVKLYHSFDKDFLADVTVAAKRHQLKVWGHTMLYPAKPVEVVNAGMEVLSHVSMLETMRTDSLFYRRTTPMAYKDSIIAGIDIIPFCKAMKKHHAILDATLCVSEAKDPWVFALLKRIHEQGVKISTGTDQIVDLNRSYPRLIDELDYFVNKCGFTPAEALYSATQISAEVIGQEKNRGSIKVGKRADIVILEENPLLDITSLKNIYMVVQRGIIIKK